MKKLLVLALIMGIASLATAGLTISAPSEVMVGEAFSITVSSDDGLQYDAYIMYAAPGAAGIISGAPEAIAVPSASVNYLGEMGGNAAWQMVNSDTSVTDPLTPGIGFTFSAEGLAEGVTDFQLLDATFAPIAGQVASVVVTPEPATMALLGLGALVLRRKK